MEKFCIPMANPGKCGFFILGMFFMLAFASWTIVTKSQDVQEVITQDSDHYTGKREKASERRTSDDIYGDIEEDYRRDRLINHIKSHLHRFGDTENVGSNQQVTPPLGENNPEITEDFERIPTFLSTLEKSFIYVHPDNNNDIPTIPWLDACEGPKELLTKLGSVMTKVWDDVGGNIKILRERYKTNATKFSTLQKIVYDDLDKSVATDDGSAAMAVLWLKRAFDFVAEFFDNIRRGKEPPAAASDAYGITLSRYHSFFVRPIFYSAMKMLGSKHDFLVAMALQREDVDRSAFEQNAMRDLEEYTTALRALLANLDDFLTETNLNS